MATGKKYYWIKLRKDFMTGDTVDFLMSQKNGAQYVVLYQMLCIMCINTGGELSRHIGEVIMPFDIDKIQRDCKYFSRDTVAVALTLFKKLGLIYEQEPGSLVISNFEDMIGSESDYAKQKREQRKNVQMCGNYPKVGIDKCADNNTYRNEDNTVDNVHSNVCNVSTQSIEKDKEKDKDKEININTICTEQKSSEPEPIITLPLNTGEEYPIFQRDINEFAELYPAVDVLQAMRGMRGWLNANPDRRKTKRGIRRFINYWLSKEQDRGGTKRYTGQDQTTPMQQWADNVRGWRNDRR